MSSVAETVTVNCSELLRTSTVCGAIVKLVNTGGVLSGELLDLYKVNFVFVF